MAEMTQRLEGIALQTRWCAERRLGYSAWEALPDPAASEGLGIIDVEGR